MTIASVTEQACGLRERKKTATRAATTTSLSLSALKSRAIYYVQAPDATQRSIVLGSMTAASAREGELWTAFTNSWVSTNASMAMNYGVPSGLPAQGHVFVAPVSYTHLDVYKRQVEEVSDALQSRYPMSSRTFPVVARPSNAR